MVIVKLIVVVNLMQIIHGIGFRFLSVDFDESKTK